MRPPQTLARFVTPIGVFTINDNMQVLKDGQILGNPKRDYHTAIKEINKNLHLYREQVYRELADRKRQMDAMTMNINEYRIKPNFGEE